MKTKTFLKRFETAKVKKITPIMHPNYFKMDAVWTNWNFRIALAATSVNVDYDCRFVNGICKVIKKDSNYYRQTKVPFMCCCRDCNPFSYIHFLPDNRKIIEMVANLVTKEHGFWKDGIGCTLPRFIRPNICLRHNCGIKEDLDIFALKLLSGDLKHSFLEKHVVNIYNAWSSIITLDLDRVAETKGKCLSYSSDILWKLIKIQFEEVKKEMKQASN